MRMVIECKKMVCASNFPMQLLRLVFVMAASVSGLASASDTVSARPNFVFFLVDDLGWADVGCNGSTFYETPNIDALAASGINFKHGYAACPVCSPTRASILTGRHPVVLEITDWIPGDDANRVKNGRFQHIDDRNSLDLSTTTVAELLKQAGYQNFFAGKWHLGGEGSLPTDHGFDFNLGGCDKGQPPGGYYAPWNNPYLKANFDGEYLDERLTDESIKFLDSRDPNKPFLLYLSFYNVHTPITPYKKRYPEFLEKASKQFTDISPPVAEHFGRSRNRQDNAEYASMIAAVDDSVGRVLKRLDELQLAENTVVIFTSDNGGLCTLAQPGPTANLPLRSGKGWLYEGGIRVPFVMRLPGVTAANQVSQTPVTSMDFLPTILELAGITPPSEIEFDGTNLVPALRESTTRIDRKLYWHYPHYHGSTWRPGAAIRDGRWKLIEFYEWDQFELYDLENDPGERNDVAMTRREISIRLRAELASWQKQVRAKMPVLK
jgi:arylsulfatase A-like enzyme